MKTPIFSLRWGFYMIGSGESKNRFKNGGYTVLYLFLSISPYVNTALSTVLIFTNKKQQFSFIFRHMPSNAKIDHSIQEPI